MGKPWVNLEHTTVPSYPKGAPYMYIQCYSNLGQFLIGMHCLQGTRCAIY